MKKLLFVLTTAVLLFLAACEGSYIEPGTLDIIGGGSIGGGSNTQHPPAVPTGVTASAQSSSSIRISWNAVSGAITYNVYRSLSANGNYRWQNDTYSASFTNTGLNSNTTYYYKVTAENSYGESSLSSYASATTQR